MRRLSFTFYVCLFAASVALFVSCSKEGSAGAVGAQGPAGSSGATGPQGPQGDTGVANVIYSDWLDVVYNPITDTTAGPTFGDTLSWTATIPAALLTATILNTGDVKVYFNLGSVAQPYIYPVPFFNGGILINASFATGNIYLDASTDVGTFTSGTSKIFQYRYILIPGGVNTLEAPDVDWNDYNSVKTYLKLKD